MEYLRDRIVAMRRFAAPAVAMLLLAGVGIGAASARPARFPVPDLTGSWINPAAPTHPAWVLKASANRQQLTATWQGAPPHAELVGHFSGTLSATRTFYRGSFQVTEGNVTGHGTLSVKIDSDDLLTVTYVQNGRTSTFKLKRKQGGGGGGGGGTPTAPTLVTLTDLYPTQGGYPQHTGSSGHYFAGPKNGTIVCGGEATADQSHCNFNQVMNFYTDQAKITATLDQPVPKGDTLAITYDGGSSFGDPNYQKCQSPASQNVGTCVLASTTTGTSVTTTIQVPNSHSDWGGIHYLDLFGTLYAPGANVGSAFLSLDLCTYVYNDGRPPVGCG